ncbi:MAG: hypothetical protein HOV80_02035 [Polyangiaceae bacterium]|nr:hypothetical protein [Polyangiaceae bacterium]
MTARRLAPVLAAALGGTLLFSPSIASADEPRKKKRMTVTVEDNEDVDQEETEAVTIKTNRRKRKRPDPPEIGAPPAEVEVYLSELKAEADIAKERAKAARRSDDEAELRLEAEEAKVFYTVERDRLTERNVGMIAGGGTLVGLGVASFVASFVLVIGWGISAIDGDADDEYGWASLGCLGGTLVGIGAGVPLIVIGSIREPKQASDAKVTAPTPFGVGTGIQVSFPF